MKNMYLKLLAKRAAFLAKRAEYQSMYGRLRTARPSAAKDFAKTAVVGAFLMSPTLAFAASDGTELLCYVAQYFKNIVGACALVVIVLWAIEHFFGVAKLHDVVIKVGIGAAVVAGAATLIAKSGLTLTCAIA